MAAKQDSNAMVAIKDITAGTVAGVFQCFIGHPLDTIKVRLQTQVPDANGNLKYTGMGNAASLMLKEEGPMGFYKGVQSPLVGLAFINSILFFAYGQSKLIVHPDQKKEMTVPEYFLAGSLTGLIVSFIEGPIDLFKSQLQVNFKSYNGLTDCATKIAKNHGIRGLYQGLGPTLVRDIIANGAYFGMYELTKKMLAGNERIDKLSSWKLLMAGGIAGMTFWVSIYPIDVIKSRMQADTPDPSKRTFTTMTKTYSLIMKQSGVSGFFKGFAPCMLRSFPANAVAFLGYEQVRRFLG